MKTMATPFKVQFIAYVSDLVEIGPDILYLSINGQFYRAISQGGGDIAVVAMANSAAVHEDIRNMSRMVIGMAPTYKLECSPFTEKTLFEIAKRISPKAKKVG